MESLRASPVVESGSAVCGTVDCASVDSGTVDSGAVDSGAVDSDAVDSDAVDSDAVDSGAVDSDAVDSDAVDSDAVDSGAVDSDAVDSGVDDSCSLHSSQASGYVVFSTEDCAATSDKKETIVSREKEFSSFIQLRAYLHELFRPFGLRVRARDTKYPQGLAKERYGENQVVGKKFECCCDGCPWSVWFRKRKNGLISLGRSFQFEHNHELSLIEGVVPRGGKDFTAEERVCLDALRQAQIGGTKSHRFMESWFRTTYTEWAVRNYIRRDRPKEIENDAERFLEMLGSKSMEGLIVHCIHVDEDGTWDMIFIGLTEGLDDYIQNGRFISVDATAETNRYGLLCVTILSQDYAGKIKAIAYAFVPRESASCYVWVFSQLKVFFHGEQPTLIVSDNHPSIFAAIRSVFPSVPHRLCWKHMKSHIRTRVKDKETLRELKVLKEFREKDQARKVFDEIAKRCKNSYLNNLRGWFSKWCDAFLPKTFVGRRSTTSINESQHNRMKLTLSASSTLVECLSVILECKQNENTTPKLRTLTVDVTNGNAVTHLAADLLEREIQKGLTCSCGYVEQMLLPCRHIVSVYTLQQRLRHVGEQIRPEKLTDFPKALRK
eukprot:TRINITY_DN849_c0_g1_i9.p1 TRINITY_DN849_c0_g1~~TRINITY_DN849_c0_g1_i9.p1  ORF type:complete len:650 (+),score=128.28 TRINITY_DN849_c0_g1_i9:133-1950(+)